MPENSQQMAKNFFLNTFKNIQMPVIVCENSEKYPLVFANPSAMLMMNPLLVSDSLREGAQPGCLDDLLRFQTEDRRASLFGPLQISGFVTDYKADILNHEDAPLLVTISANLVEVQGAQCIVMYIYDTAEDELSAVDVNNMLGTVFQMSNQVSNVDDAITGILAYVGSWLHVSRAYIFEEISAEYTRNTYEWCGPGEEPAIQDLQNLKKADYNYDAIVNGGMYITDDVRNLPDGDREILEAQGIKSLAIMPMAHQGKPLGYIGFDDCKEYRKWSRMEINLLKSLSGIILALLVRRNNEQKIGRSAEILQTISDSIENIIYVNDVNTYEIVFLNKTLADAMGRDAEEFTGGTCWKLLQKDMTGPCPFCPIPKMLAEGYMETGKYYTWEFQNTLTNKWYLIKDAFIKWIDGRTVHIETATEITHQKEYEQQLQYYASTDGLTGVYNREWGHKIMREIVGRTGNNPEDGSLVFIDLDGLKYVNDTFGHDVGDQMINNIVQIARASIRKSDAICRWGGDEFLLLLRCKTEVAERIMRTINERIAAFNAAGKAPYILSISHGITELSAASTESVEVIVSRADQLMYQNKMAKRGGKKER